MTPTLWAAGACGVALIVVSLASLFRVRSRRGTRQRRREIDRRLHSIGRAEFRAQLREQRNGLHAEKSTKQSRESKRPQ